MSKKNEIMQAIADLVKAMAILKEKQEAIEQRLIIPSFEKGGHINNKDGEFIPPLNDPSKTAIPVSIEDLQLLRNWFTGNGEDIEPVISPSKFFQKYLP